MSDKANDEVLLHWPGGWPGQNVVDLDNLGDPGIWLNDRQDLIEEVLRGDEVGVREAAGVLAADYIEAAGAMSFPIPSDFDATDVETRAMIESDFHAFLLEWRRRIDSARKNQSP